MLFISWNPYLLTVDANNRRSILHKVRITSMTIISGTAFINIGVIWFFPVRFLSWNSYLLTVDAINRRSILHKVRISGIAFINMGVIWSFHCGLYPETHTCWQWMQSIEGQYYIRSALHQWQSYLVAFSWIWASFDFSSAVYIMKLILADCGCNQSKVNTS